MFKLSVDDRISFWANFRKELGSSSTPFQDVIDLWKEAPFIPHNTKIDPYYQQSWPTPWEILVYNKYDDLTKAIMMGWTIKLTKKYENNKIEIRTIVDNNMNTYYNIVNVDDKWVLNYKENEVCEEKIIPFSFLIQNLVELKLPR